MAAAAAAAKDFSNEILLDIDSDFMLILLHFPQAMIYLDFEFIF